MATEPHVLSPDELRGAIDRHDAITEFFDRSLDILEAALAGEEPHDLLELLLNDTPESIADEFHRRILSRRRSYPQFFRTDEVRPGRIIEIQCPGSLWGECDALSFIYDFQEGERPTLALDFARQLTARLSQSPKVHHLLDNASVPHTMRYFIDRTRPDVQYFGLDRGLSQLECNFVRSHSVYGLVAENFFLPRLARYLDGELIFDLPPLVIFDQKATLALPFLERTRSLFSDSVRDALVFTSPVTPDGFSLPDGSWISLEKFAGQPRADRRWMLKYAGTDVSINWGSRAVFTLDNLGREACLRKLTAAAEDQRRRRFWVVQPQEQAKQRVEYVDESNRVISGDLTAKHSTFYGPLGYLGTLVQYRDFYKVHGQPDTVVALGVQGDQRQSTMEAAG